MTKPFFCISYFDGDISWVESVCNNNYVIYNKGLLPDNSLQNIVKVPNVGYNIFSYLCYIIDNYEKLPELIIFCKNNVFDRHVSRKLFETICERKIFTPIEEQGRWERISFPASVISSDGGFLELNNSWYVTGYDRRFFHNFDSYFNFIFDGVRRPEYLRFAPGANYLVPREHVLLRSKSFYINLREFVSHSQYSCESHFVERSLISIWSSGLIESELMSKVISIEKLDGLALDCAKYLTRDFNTVNRIRRGLMNRVSATAKYFFG